MGRLTASLHHHHVSIQELFLLYHAWAGGKVRNWEQTSMTCDLPQLRLGPLAIDFPVVQAALSGYSDWPMRVIARRFGAAYTVCEVMLDQFILNVTKGRKAKRFLRVTDEEHPCGTQLMGAVPEHFPPAALKLVEAGFDVIDLNFACPVKKVLGRCRGGFLLSDPTRRSRSSAGCARHCRRTCR